MRQGKQHHGFVLILTLLVLFIVALATAYFAERVARSVALAEQYQQNANALVNMESTRSEVLYRLATTSVTEYGLGRGNAVISLDNRPYLASGDTVVSIQDERGLFNLNAFDSDRMNRLLGLMGTPADQRAHLIDTLRDYTDPDDLHRLNGAEKEEYLALNLPPPPNRFLVSPWEAKAIIGWRSASNLWQNNRLPQLTSASPKTDLNPNTAPAEVLATLPGVTAEIAQRIIAARQITPITNLVQFGAITELPTQAFEEIISILPSNSLRITQSAPGMAWAVQYNVILTPRDDQAPWQISYSGRIADIRPAAGQATATSPPLPPRSMAPAETPPP